MILYDHVPFNGPEGTTIADRFDLMCSICILINAS